jgi:hypothetical protein
LTCRRVRLHPPQPTSPDSRFASAEQGSPLANCCFEIPSDGDETRNLVRGKMPRMKITTGIVVDGKVVVEGESLAEGSTVTVLLRDNEEAFELTPAEEDELLDSIAQIEGGEFVSGEQLLERLRRFG